MRNGRASEATRVAKRKPNDSCWCGSGRKYKHCHQHRDLLANLRGESVTEDRRTVRPGRVSPMRSVPDHIVRPEYALTGRPRSKQGIEVVKTAEQIERMRNACRHARQILDMVCDAVAPGVTTEALDELVHNECIRRGGYPSTLNYHHFAKSMCTSVNEVICHGIPDDRPLENGDTINCDITIYIDGVHGDCSKTVLVGDVEPEHQRLVETTYESMLRGIGAIKPGGRVHDIGRAIQPYAEERGYSVVRKFVGHGIGEVFHMPPEVPHYFDQSARMVLKPGMTLTVEPMINQGTPQETLWDDGWTAVTADLKRSAQFEHTLLVTDEGVEILTIADGEQQPFKH